MKLETIWIVTKPTADSTLADICFETTMVGLQRQFLGGLRADEIAGVYDDKEEARGVAATFLHSVRR